MAVVTKYSGAVQDPAVLTLTKAIDYDARHRIIAPKPIDIANGDSATSQIFFAKVPSNGRIDPRSSLYHTAITGLTSLHIGLTYNGTTSASCLASALDLSTAGSKSMAAAVTAGNLGKAFWELLGLTKDPNAEIDLFFTMNTAATAAGSIAGSLYVLREA